MSALGAARFAMAPAWIALGRQVYRILLLAGLLFVGLASLQIVRKHSAQTVSPLTVQLILDSAPHALHL